MDDLMLLLIFIAAMCATLIICGLVASYAEMRAARKPSKAEWFVMDGEPTDWEE